MEACYKTDAAKKSVNLSLNSDLLRQGKDLGLNLSALAEAALAEAVKARLEEDWLRENEAAIHAYNRRVDQHGTFGDRFRSF